MPYVKMTVVVAGLIDFDVHDCGIHTTKLDLSGCGELAGR